MKTLKGKWIWWNTSIGFCEEETEHGIYVSQVSRQPYPDDEMHALPLSEKLERYSVPKSSKLLDCFIPWNSLGKVALFSDNQKEKLKV